MYINDFFKDGYKSIYETDDKSEFIDAFLDDTEEGEKPGYSLPLENIFIHESKNEMFLVLNCIDLNFSDIKEVCEDWEFKVLHFVNTGNEYRDNIQYLKYEITLLILCKDEEGNLDDDFRSEIEKSLKICRKVFLLCEDDGKISEDNWTMIPFYFSSVEVVDSKEIQKLESDLESLVSFHDNEILSICEKDKLTTEDTNKMYGWLSDNDNY